MSMEAQFYEARRRQSAIERRQSLRTEKEFQQEYQTLYIPVRFHRQETKPNRCTCSAIHHFQLPKNDQSLYQRDRDIYPRPIPIATNNNRRHFRRPKLFNRFSSIDYLQQW